MTVYQASHQNIGNGTSAQKDAPWPEKGKSGIVRYQTPEARASESTL